MSGPPSHLRAQILDAIRDEPAVTRPLEQRRQRAVRLAAIGFVAVVVLKLGGVVLEARPGSFVAVVAIGWVMVAIAAWWFGVTRGRSMTGRSRSRLFAIAVGT